MGHFYQNPEVETALIRLNDLLCEDERNAGSHTVLLLIPLNPNEPIHMSQDGKPLPQNTTLGADDLVRQALEEREKVW
ncbi:MAG: hypothetical protein V1763_00800 [Parcubacteria group bacterium]